ncbi:MAG TPA: haloacid dehalogenase type II [Candidatus Angelobacter sp.]|nr:haloacid dehalogenase type II [Candidatus Angelobacter sp.]
MAIEAILFDVFGTVVDWRSSLIRRLQQFGAGNNLEADWAALADDWRAEYEPAMNAVRSGQRPWTPLERLHRESLHKLLQARGLASITEPQRQQIVSFWHYLDPWPDAVAGLLRLKRKYIIGTLSNGGVRLLADMAKYASLSWDVIFSSDSFRRYKPQPEVYLGAAELLDTRPENVMLAAAHNYDLAAARSHGMKTAFIPRPSEYGPRQARDFKAESDWDFIAQDFQQLALQLET